MSNSHHQRKVRVQKSNTVPFLDKNKASSLLYIQDNIHVSIQSNTKYVSIRCASIRLKWRTALSRISGEEN